jgi:hypothetical protein
MEQKKALAVCLSSQRPRTGLLRKIKKHVMFDLKLPAG